MLARTSGHQTVDGVKTLRSARELFDIPASVTYLNCANMAPHLRSVRAAGLGALNAGATPWKRSAKDWFAPAEELRALFARIVNCESGAIALVPSVSYGLAIAAANLAVGAGQSVIVLDGEFPSNVYVWRDLAKRRGANLVVAKRSPDGTWTDAVLGALGRDTAVVSVPNCHWTDGALVDLDRVASAARGVGSAFVIDASQSAGAYPLDVAALNPDFLVTVGYKWLLGPYGLAYLYVAPRWHAQGAPLEQSWMARAGAEDFARLAEYRDLYREGARRFDMGEFAQFLTMPMAIAALTQVVRWGVQQVQKGIASLTSKVEREASDAGAVVSGAARVGHIVGLRPLGGIREELVAALAAEAIYVSVRGDVLRVAPHLYNDAGDVERLLSILRRHARAA